jgi:hypothetical protein
VCCDVNRKQYIAFRLLVQAQQEFSARTNQWCV